MIVPAVSTVGVIDVDTDPELTPLFSTIVPPPPPVLVNPPAFGVNVAVVPVVIIPFPLGATVPPPSTGAPPAAPVLVRSDVPVFGNVNRIVDVVLPLTTPNPPALHWIGVPN